LFLVILSEGAKHRSFVILREGAKHRSLVILSEGAKHRSLVILSEGAKHRSFVILSEGAKHRSRRTARRAATPAKTGNIMTKRSRYSYSETIAKLSKAMTDAGNTIFTTIDQAAAAAQVGLTLRPTTLIIFGNPKGGTPLMEAFPLVALELPLKLLVWEEHGAVNLAYTPMSEVAARYSVTGMDARISAMDQALAALVENVG
jgi:uncharacterized protein (DUF302 family)